MARKADDILQVDGNDSVWATTDKAVIREYRAVVKRTNGITDLMFRECVEGFNREPIVMDYRSHFSLVGLHLREKDFDWQTDPRRGKYGSVPEDEPPIGWRKRVKDDYFTPEPKAKDADAVMARELLSRYARIDNARSWLEERYGGPASHFYASPRGMHFGSPGFHLTSRKGQPTTLWVWCGKGYAIKSDKFAEMKPSEFLEVLGR